MVEIRDCLGKLVCMVDAERGLVERRTSKDIITMILSVGDKVAFESKQSYVQLELKDGPIFYVNSYRN